MVRPHRASLWAVRDADLRCTLGSAYSITGIMKDLIVETIGVRLRCSRMADGMVGRL